MFTQSRYGAVMSAVRPQGPTVLDALSLLAEVADDLALKTVRDTHTAWVDRIYDVVQGRQRRRNPAELIHRGVAGAVYGGLGLGLRAASVGLDKAAATGLGPRLEDDRRGRFVNSAVNGLIGDKLLRERPQLAIPLAARIGGRDVEPTREGLAAAYPSATG